MMRFARFLLPLIAVAFVLAGCGGAAAPQQPASAPTTAPAQPAAPTAVPAATAAPTQVPAALAPTTAPTQAPTAQAQAPATSAQGKAITVQMGANDPRSIDPQRAIDTRDWQLLAMLFPSLAVLNVETNELMPGMAESWDVSSDGKIYTFHLLKQVPWVRYNAQTGAAEQAQDSDGKPRYVTANDFVYGFLRALDPATGSPAAYMLAPYIDGATEFNAGKGSRDKVGVKAIDDYTFQIAAPEKVGFALAIYSIINARATPEWAIKASGDAWTEPENINTYGPFVLKAWEHESSQTYVRNSFWPGSKGIRQPGLDQITFRFIDEAVGLREYEAGTIDVTAVPGDQIERIRVDSKLSAEFKVVPGACTGAFGLHTKKPPFDNLHIRRAFNYAVDRQSLVTDVLAGGQIPAQFFTPPSISGAPSGAQVGDLGIKFDPDKAKQELALGLKELGLASVDQLPKITMEFGTGQEASSVAQALQAMWQDTLGVQVELAEIDNTVYWSKQEKDAGQIFRAGWCPDYNDANNYLRDVYRSDSIYNYGKWTNETYDSLVDQARVETDQAARLKLYTQAEQLLTVEDAGTLALFYPVRAQLTKPGIKRTFSLTALEAYWDWEVAS